MLRILTLLFILSGCGSSYEWEVRHPATDRLPQNYDFSVDIRETSASVLPLLPHPDSIVFQNSIGDRSSLEDEFYRLSHLVIGSDGHTFGFTYSTKSGRQDMSLSKSLLSCNETTNTVIAYSMYFPYIIGYSPQGDEKWRSNVEGFVSWEFIEFKSTEYKNPGMLFFTNKDILNDKYPIQDIPLSEYSLLQFGWNGPFSSPNQHPIPNPPIRSENKEPRTRTILVNTATGELLHSDVYPPIGDIRDGRMMTYEIVEPYQILFSQAVFDTP